MKLPSGTPVVKYGDVFLGGATVYDWEFRSGSTPVERAFTVSAARADACTQYLGTPQTLTIEGPRATLRVEHVYLLEIQPGDDPYTKRIRLADRRWLWPKRWVMATLNLRRTNGNRFLVGEGRIENKLIQPEIRYARFSLYPPENPGTVWTIRDALTWLVRDVLETPIVFDDEPVDVEIQDIDLDDSGPAAVDRLLSHVPGLDLYIDAAGTAHVYDVFSGREAEIREKLPPLHRDGGWVGTIDKRALRPREVVVLFTPEAEFRVDYEEPTTGGTRTRRDEDEPRLTNVAPTCDVETVIDGEVLARSSWADLEKQFAAWGPFGIHNEQITFDHLRKYALKYGWASFEQAWGNNPLLPPDSVNLARAATTAQCWRRVFRLDRYWVQRLHSIRPYRTAIVNYETGAYAPATVYTDWIRRPSYKGFAHAADPNVSQGWAVRGYPSSGKLADAEPAPARVDMLDAQAGVIAVTPQVDPYGLSQAMLFGYPEGGSLPSQALGDANRTGQELFARWDQVVLEAGWKLAVVLTVVPASPNNIDRAYKVTVTPDQIGDLGPCEGPTVYARVFPGVMTARFAWSDDQAEALKAAIKGEGPWPESLLVNPEFVQDVALATAKRVYDPLRDRPTGSPSFDLAPDIYPAGTVSAVRHTVASGEVTTSLVFGTIAQAVDLNRYLSASTRKAINMILNDRRA